MGSVKNEKLSFSKECSLINTESFMDVENYDFAIPSIIIVPGQNHPQVLKSLSDRLLRNLISTKSSVSSHRFSWIKNDKIKLPFLPVEQSNQHFEANGQAQYDQSWNEICASWHYTISSLQRPWRTVLAKKCSSESNHEKITRWIQIEGLPRRQLAWDSSKQNKNNVMRNRTT